MIKTVFFDMDGTLYDEAYPKVRAELLTSEYIHERTQVGVCEIYDTFRRVKSVFTKSCSDAMRKNNRKMWFDETLRELNISGITGEEAGEYYWSALLKELFDFALSVWLTIEIVRFYCYNNTVKDFSAFNIERKREEYDNTTSAGKNY